ncbi:MAG: dicarboxylate/amino acid:cation symporter [Gemmatimonadetes bacterium]|nr:dicarboxylate/amino acid:cation symporter [Gemmatimonadota bacterium]
MSAEGGRPRVPLHIKILIGLGVGAVAGVASNLLWRGTPALDWAVDNVANPVGQVFLRMLFMVVVPLVFTTLALGVANLGDLRRLGRVGGKTFGFFVFTTGIAVTLGLILANTVEPGARLDDATRLGLMQEYAGDAATRIEASETMNFGIGTFIAIVPRNFVQAAATGDMLGIIFFTLIFGVALTRIPKKFAQPVLDVLEGVAQAVIEIIGLAMKLAPYGVAGLIFAVTARFGFEVLGSLALYVVMVLAGLLIHQFVTLGILAQVLAGISPARFFAKMKYVMITAFSTSSSSATMPTTLRTAEEEFGVPREIAGFVVPLGATMNMNGTALFEGMTVLFLAQVFGVDLTLGQQLIVVIMAIITAIGAAGVPAGSIPLLVMVLIMVGVPGEGIALILGVDRILDMARTVPNVTGDVLTSIVIARSEGLELTPAAAPDFSTEAAVEAVEHVS